jgi:hypothetical protein
VVQGRSDAFGRPDELPRAAHVTVAAVDGDHTLAAAPEQVLAVTAAWLMAPAT